MNENFQNESAFSKLLIYLSSSLSVNKPVLGSIPTFDVRAGLAPPASSGKCEVARTGPWLEPGLPDDAISRSLSI